MHLGYIIIYVADVPITISLYVGRFAAIIHEAKTGEPTSWWAWTADSKNLQKAGKLTHLV